MRANEQLSLKNRTFSILIRSHRDRPLQMEHGELPIHEMAQRHVGLSQAIAEHQTEGARVCLDRHHKSPTTFQIEGSKRVVESVVNWTPTDQRTQQAWGNERYATEHGAYAFALAAVELACGLISVSRAETGTGVDFYIAPPDTSFDDLENHIRFEVSGVGQGDGAAVAKRLTDKLNQAKKGNSNLPAIAGVVGFPARQILLGRLEDS